MDYPIMTSSGRPRHRLLWALCSLLLALGCREAGTPTDGETHFLRVCDSECGSSEQDLVCLCGVCTLPCAQSAACQELSASAECVADVDRPEAAACSDPAPAAFCDVPCTTDQDCGVLSSSHRCTSGYCRAIPDTGAGDAATAGAEGGACPRGEVNGNEVLVLGDSFIARTTRSLRTSRICLVTPGRSRPASAIGTTRRTSRTAS